MVSCGALAQAKYVAPRRERDAVINHRPVIGDVRTAYHPPALAHVMATQESKGEIAEAIVRFISEVMTTQDSSHDARINNARDQCGCECNRSGSPGDDRIHSDGKTVKQAMTYAQDSNAVRKKRMNIRCKNSCHEQPRLASPRKQISLTPLPTPHLSPPHSHSSLPHTENRLVWQVLESLVPSETLWSPWRPERH